MKVPVSWLKSIVDFQEDLETLSDQLTFLGLEVEAIESVDGEKVIELEITPNRPDCLSIIGIAREVSILSGLPLSIPEVKIKRNTDPELKVKVEAAEECSRYTACIIDGVSIQPSPDWIQKRLIAVGIRPINNIVDITNYVMLETGHPLHAFDAALIDNNEINVRHAKEDEMFDALNGTTYKLNSNMLVIADRKKSIALAGVIGGANTEISGNTKTVVLEAACFDTSSVRATSKQLGVNTDSSYRFQRGICAESVARASDRAASLIMELAGASSCSSIIDIYDNPVVPPSISFTWNRIISLIGASISVEEMENIFEKLSVKITNKNQSLIATPPSFRLDLEREIDLVEEIARVFGVSNIPSNPPQAKISIGKNNERVRAIGHLRSLLQGLGASEIINYTLVSHGLLDALELDDKNEREQLPHPISEDQSVLRTSLIPQLIESLGRNHARQIHEACFYEIGRIFKRKEETMQYEHLSIGMMGPVGRSVLNKREPITDEEQFIWLKGFIEELLEKLGIDDIRFSPIEHAGFESNQAVKIERKSESIGLLGLISKATREDRRIMTPVAVAELGINSLLQGAGKIPVAIDLPIYPSTNRDLAIIVDHAVSHESILEIINKAKISDLEHVCLFDVYTGKGVKEGKKSLAYNFIYRSSKETLTDEHVNKSHQQIMDLLSTELSAEIRV